MDDQSRAAEMKAHIEALKERVEARDVISRLYKNRDFKRAIVQGFCTDECARYAKISSNLAIKAEDRADALNLAQSAGYLERFLNAQLKMGDRAEAELEQAEAALREIESGEDPEA